MVATSRFCTAATRLSSMLLLTCTVLVAAEEASGGQLTTSWTDNSGGTATTRIERRLAVDTAFVPVADVPPGTNSWVDGSVSAGTTYCYRALAYDTKAASPYSEEACATTGSTTSTLDVTVGLSGDGTGLVTSTPSGLNCKPTCSVTFAGTSAVTLAAMPGAGSTFTGWSGGGCAGTSTCRLADNTPVAVTANFALSTNTTALLLSSRADRSSPTPLTGTTVAQDIFVFLGPVSATRVQFFVDDPEMSRSPFQTELYAPFDLAGGTVETAAPFDTRLLLDGTHTVTAVVDLSTGGTAVLSANFTVANSMTSSPPTTGTTADTTQPVITLAIPSNATFIRKSRVELSAVASDNIGVAKVEFHVNGSRLCSDSSNPYICVWQIPAAPKKTYVLQATATDAAGNVGVSNRITVASE
jgi:Bacterial Ig domain